MPNSNGSTNMRWMTGVAGSLLILAVSGWYNLGSAQSALKENVKANTAELDRRESAVMVIPVIQVEIEHIKQNMKKDHDGFKRDHDVILEAIKDLKNSQ